MGAGVQGNFVLGDADDRISDARAAVASQGAITSAEEAQAYTEGVISQIMFAPGLSPWVGARVGVGYDTEAGLTYTGRTARVDARHSFETNKVALSAGLGASAVLSRRGDSPDIDSTAREQAVPGVDVSGLSGWGFDVPVIVGWRSNAELIQSYVGVRGGYERISGDVLLRIEPNPTTDERASFEAHRWQAGGLAGLMVSIEPLWVAVELGVAYGWAEGTLERTVPAGGLTTFNGDATTLTLGPAGAFGGRF
jgi:hypothetical protein